MSIHSAALSFLFSITAQETICPPFMVWRVWKKNILRDDSSRVVSATITTVIRMEWKIHDMHMFVDGYQCGVTTGG